jgi:hypothetical protein
MGRGISPLSAHRHEQREKSLPRPSRELFKLEGRLIQVVKNLKELNQTVQDCAVECERR